MREGVGSQRWAPFELEKFMVRKHSRYLRSRMKRSRPKTPAPKHGWRMAELSRLSGISVRTLRAYAAKGLIRPIERRGTQTRYPRVVLLRLAAILTLQRTTKLTLLQMKRKFETLDELELERWLATEALAPQLATALGFAAVSTTPAATTPAATTPAATTPPTSPSDSATVAAKFESAPGVASVSAAQLRPTTETWYHVELLPGLILQLSSAASPVVSNAARRVYDEFVGNVRSRP
jgi:DNA-binding transcriptional MerR regulator